MSMEQPLTQNYDHSGSGDNMGMTSVENLKSSDA